MLPTGASHGTGVWAWMQATSRARRAGTRAAKGMAHVSKWRLSHFWMKQYVKIGPGLVTEPIFHFLLSERTLDFVRGAAGASGLNHTWDKQQAWRIHRREQPSFELPFSRLDLERPSWFLSTRILLTPPGGRTPQAGLGAHCKAQRIYSNCKVKWPVIIMPHFRRMIAKDVFQASEKLERLALRMAAPIRVR